MTAVLAAAAVGLAVGRGLRWALPWLLRAKAGRGLPFALPWPELATAAAFALLAAERGTAVHQLKWYVFAALLIAATATDLHSKLIPDRLTWPGTALGVALTARYPHDAYRFLHQTEFLDLIGWTQPRPHLAGLVLALCGALAGFLAIDLFRRLVGLLTGVQGMGQGDAKLLMLIGAFLGPYGAALTILPACAVGAVASALHRWRSGQPHAPFGPALAAGALILLLWSDRLLAALWQASLAIFALPRWLTAAFYLGMIGLLVLIMLRIRRRAADYARAIEDDYQAIEASLRGDSEVPNEEQPAAAPAARDGS